MTDDKGMIWQSYRYDVFGEITFGKPQYNNVYSYNAENYNPNIDSQYLRARYYSVGTANFLTEDSYLGEIADPLSLNRYNYTKSSPLNYIDPSGHVSDGVYYDPTHKPNTGGSSYPAGKPGGYPDIDEYSLGNLLNQGKEYIKKMLALAEKNEHVQDCGMYIKGVKYGMSQFWRMLDSYTFGEILSWVGLDSLKYSKEEAQEAYSRALEDALEGREYTTKEKKIFDKGMDIGFYLGFLSLLELATSGQGSGPEQQTVLVQDANGIYTVVIPAGAAEKAAGLDAAAIIQQIEQSKDEGDSETKSIEDILEGAEETTNNAGVARNFEKSGGFEKTLEDFDALNPTNVKDIQTQYGPGNVGTLSDGTSVVARPGSKTGGSTLEIKVTNSKIYKIIYYRRRF